MVVVEERGNECLGDDTVVPSNHWGRGQSGFINFVNDETGGRPLYFDNGDDGNYTFVIASSDNDDCYQGNGSTLSPFISFTFGIILFSIMMIKH